MNFSRAPGGIVGAPGRCFVLHDCRGLCSRGQFRKGSRASFVLRSGAAAIEDAGNAQSQLPWFSCEKRPAFRAAYIGCYENCTHKITELTVLTNDGCVYQTICIIDRLLKRQLRSRFNSRSMAATGSFTTNPPIGKVTVNSIINVQFFAFYPIHVREAGLLLQLNQRISNNRLDWD